MSVYYNENDPACAAWLRELIKAGELPRGDVDERSIEDVAPNEIDEYEQCHFFAGIGGWPLALQWAGWSGPVWTGSCPCQPFSAAGARRGTDDPRHLWPVWRWLIDQCRPPTVFGEQVASKAGREWLAGVFTDLEAMAYAAAGADLCAAGVGAPHIRQRLWWVGHSSGYNQRWTSESAMHGEGIATGGSGGSGSSGVGHADNEGPQGRGILPERTDELASRSAGVDSPWDECTWTPCADGKARRIEPGLEPLAHGVSGRVGLLRGYGNAIVPQVAASFVTAYMETK